MNLTKKYLLHLLSSLKVSIPTKNEAAFTAFASRQDNIDKVRQIQELQTKMAKDWELISRKLDIQNMHILFPNGTNGKEYEADLDFNALDLNDLTSIAIVGLEHFGLQYFPDKKVIYGIPTASGDLKFSLHYKVENDSETELLHKELSIIINPDPKSLWKNIPSDENDPHWKPDNESTIYPLGEKTAVAASKRGRSHANKGSFRDDAFKIKHFDQYGWSIAVVSDGAGSAKLGRKGAEIACESVIQYFEQYFNSETIHAFESGIADHFERQKDLHVCSDPLFNAAKHAYHSIADFAVKNDLELNDLHATLIFSLFKKFNFGYAILSFGIGDCPIGLMNVDQTAVVLMNTMDVGEFGGGTRFVTMPEVFAHPNFASRFNFEIFPDFSYLILMTDGIYDPKFEVEANLQKIEKWNALIDDIKGENPEKFSVNLDAKNTETANGLSQWMDFWSPGNHDDRTLLLIY